jgi:hypothetical protein
VIALSAVAVTSATGAPCDPGTLVLTPEDTYLNVDGVNYSRDPQLSAYTWPDNKVARAIVMKFDLSGVPAGVTIQDATLNLSLIQSDKAPDVYAIGAHKIVGARPVIAAATGLSADGSTPWTLNPCCANNAPLAQADITAPYDVQLVSTTPGATSWNLTGMVNEWLADPASNAGLVLNADTSKPRDRFRVFASMDHQDASLHPYLRLTYSDGTTASSAVRVNWGAAPGVKTASATASASAIDSDHEPPKVSIAGPSPRTPVVGAATLRANASDNVAVAAVQFQLDGMNIGGEATAPAFTSSWDSSSTTNGAHTLLAIARDAAGNTRASIPVTITVLNKARTLADSGNRTGNGGGGVPGGGGTGGGGGAGSTGPGVKFNSTWDTATGFGANAVTDGGKWPNYWEFNHNDGTQLLSVVSGGPGGHNALRVQQRSATYAANVQVDNVVPKSTDYYLRFYMRNDDTSGAGDHIVTVDTWKYANLTFMRKVGHSNNWNFVASLYGCGYTYPIGHWGPTEALEMGKWYRFEYLVDFIDATHIQLHPRVYDANGNLLYSDADFKQTAPGLATWNGRSDWSLASYYAAGNSFCVDPEPVNDIGLGNNGQQGSANTGQYWYFAGVQVRTDTWPGAMAPVGSGDSAPAGAGPAPNTAAPSAPADAPVVVSPRSGKPIKRGGGGSLPPGEVEGVSHQSQQPGPAQQVPENPPSRPGSRKTDGR